MKEIERLQNMKVAENGLCKISDTYFSDFSSPRHMFNKHENRPYYLAIKQHTGIYWLVPLSSQLENYRVKIQAAEKLHGESVFYHIAKVKGKESVFLIGNAIPVTEEYIAGPFTVAGIPYVLGNKEEIKAIRSKLNRYLALVRSGKLHPAVNILEIEHKLLSRKQNSAYIV